MYLTGDEEQTIADAVYSYCGELRSLLVDGSRELYPDYITASDMITITSGEDGFAVRLNWEPYDKQVNIAVKALTEAVKENECLLSTLRGVDRYDARMSFTKGIRALNKKRRLLLKIKEMRD